MSGASRRPRGIDKYLAPSENVLYTFRRHPVVIAKPIIAWVAAITLGGVVGFLTSPRDPGTTIDKIAGAFVVVVTVWATWRFVRWFVAAYVVTDLRVMLVEGLVAKTVGAIPLSKVTDTTFRRSIIGRVLGYGDLMLDSPGETPGLDTLTKVPKPEKLYRLIMAQVLLDEEPVEEETRPRDEDETGEIPRITV